MKNFSVSVRGVIPIDESDSGSAQDILEALIKSHPGGTFSVTVTNVDAVYSITATNEKIDEDNPIISEGKS